MNIFKRVVEFVEHLSFVERLAARIEAIEEFLEQATSTQVAHPVEPTEPPAPRDAS